MIRPWMIYGAILTLAMGASWFQYTGGDAAGEKEGVVLIDEKKDTVERLEYLSPELDVLYEIRTDEGGKFGWVTVTDRKQKKFVKEGEVAPPVEPKITRFKAGSAGDKLLDGLAPLLAMRELVGVDDVKLESFGLNKPEGTVKLTAGGRSATLELGGETYGAKDRYVRHLESGKYYVVDDELLKPLKFASTRLPERALFTYKVEEIDTVTLAKGDRTTSWTQHNKEDRAADWWERLAATGSGDVGKKDESFTNWLEKALKLKSINYIQEADVPAEKTTAFDLTFAVTGKTTETLHVYQSGDDWYADGTFTHGLVKLTKSAVADAADEVSDILDGKEPPPDVKTPPIPPPLKADESDGAPGGPPGGPMGGPGGRPGMPMPGGRPMPPGMPAGMPPGMAPKAPPSGG